MKTAQFQELIKHATGRNLTIKIESDEIPLDAKIAVYRPGSRWYSFIWKTPKNEDSLLRSFITAFCTKYKEPDPSTYEERQWERYAEKWDNLETRFECGAWYHHSYHMLSKDKLREQIAENFANFSGEMGRLGFYSTNYGIGLFTAFGGKWVEDSLSEMKMHLEKSFIPFSNELSEKGWVTRFLIKTSKENHTAILGGF
jgi:hypothetical protein